MMNDPELFKNPCAICERKVATQLCDYIIKYDDSIIFARDYEDFKELNAPMAKYKTCDLPMCNDCAKKIGNNLDFCPHHYDLHSQVELPSKKLKDYQWKQKIKAFQEAMEDKR